MCRDGGDREEGGRKKIVRKDKEKEELQEEKWGAGGTDLQMTKDRTQTFTHTHFSICVCARVCDLRTVNVGSYWSLSPVHNEDLCVYVSVL